MSEQHMPAWEDAAQQICEAVETATAETVRKTCDDIYSSVMETVQDCLQENVAFNLASKLAAYEREAAHLRKEATRISDIAERMAEISSTFLDAVDDLCDWMNGNDLAADHSEARPKDFDRLCTAMEGMRSALSAFRDAGR